MSKNRLGKPSVPVLIQHKLAEMGSRATVVRRARHLTQADLAHLADVGVSTVASIEGGHDGVSIGNLLKVLSALDLISQSDGLFELASDPGLVAFGKERLEPVPHHRFVRAPRTER